jgi:iron complex transport system ATP-binding protein
VPEERIAVKGLTHVIGDASLLDSIDLSVAGGEFVGVLGPNGAGKSTLLSAIAGELRPTSGSVDLMGSRVTSLSSGELARVRSMLGSNPPVDIPFAARTVVEAGRNPYRGTAEGTADRDSQMVESAMARADVGSLAERSFATLSSGEQARVMIARILAQDTPVALLDEPTAALDAASGERALRSLSSDRGSDTTILCVLHDLNQAAFHCSRLLLMDKGRLVSDGAPWDVLDEDLLTSVYSQPMRVVEHPFRDCPLVLVG